MRVLIFTFLAFFVPAIHLSAQLKTAKFDNTFELQDGIYTTYTELLNNSPVYPGCILKTNPARQDIFISDLTYYVIGNETDEKKYNAPLFATVVNKRLCIYYDQTLFPIYTKGTLCTFILKKEPANGYSPSMVEPGKKPESMINLRTKYKYLMYFLDIQTGKIVILNKENLGESIKRDSVLYKSYLKVKPGKDDKNLLKYIADFNARNPTLLPVRNEAITEEE